MLPAESESTNKLDSMDRSEDHGLYGISKRTVPILMQICLENESR